MKVSVKPVKTILGIEYMVVVSKWFGLQKANHGIYFTQDFARVQARILANQFQIEYSLI